MRPAVTIKPFNIEAEYCDGDVLLDVIRRAGIPIASYCGGRGTCGKCVVELQSGAVEARPGMPRVPVSTAVEASAERKELVYACSVRIRRSCSIVIPGGSIDESLQTQTNHLEVRKFTSGKPAVEFRTVSPPAPDIDDTRSDADRLAAQLMIEHGVNARSIDARVLRQLSQTLRSNVWNVGVTLYQHEIISVGSPQQTPLVVAVDIGTTTCAIYLLECIGGAQLAAAGVANPQTPYGADVVSRLSTVVEEPALAATLRAMLVEQINTVVERLCAESGVTVDRIACALFVGNTAMHHLFLGLGVEQLVNSPYVATVSREYLVKAREISLSVGPGAYACCLPIVAGYVGSDHVAMLLACSVLQQRRNVLYVDMGTNTEICLATAEGLFVVSTPSGPAFEGAHIQLGMRAEAGAIDACAIDEQGDFTYSTIGGQKPRGLCGSGILDAIGAAFGAGIIDWRGRLQQCRQVKEVSGQRRLMIVAAGDNNENCEVFLTQADIREFQLAKGAISAGIAVLAQRAAIELHDITKVVIAGAFGSQIDVGNALRLGILPLAEDTQIVQVGNAAGAGACMAAVDAAVLETIHAICSEIQYVELVNAAAFKSIYSRATYLGNRLTQRGQR